MHENIVCYDDEGGGEEDTEAFDIYALWGPRVEPLVNYSKQCQDTLPEVQSLPGYVPQPGFNKAEENNTCVHGYMLAKLYETDSDPCAPPYDSLHTYAYEGEGSVAESLSSLQSAASHTDHDYNYLNDWGPRFQKLAEMYGVNDNNSQVW